MRFVIITGYSGSGKTNAMKTMEALGYFCVDNLPPVLIPKFADICKQGGHQLENVAIAVDMRGGELFNSINEALLFCDLMKFPYEILFFQASEEALVRRYKESRLSHPLSPDGRILDGIIKEQELLAEIRQKATKIIDTTDLELNKLKETLHREFATSSHENMRITVVSFGFKRGIPYDADMVFDVRFLPNPFYIASLRPFSGREKAIKDYVFSFDEANVFVEKTLDMIEYILPFYRKEAKADIVVAIGCTGGMHRSVAIAEKLYSSLSTAGHHVTLEHRDIENEKIGVKYKRVE